MGKFYHPFVWLTSQLNPVFNPAIQFRFAILKLQFDLHPKPNRNDAIRLPYSKARPSSLLGGSSEKNCRERYRKQIDWSCLGRLLTASSSVTLVWEEFTIYRYHLRRNKQQHQEHSRTLWAMASEHRKNVRRWRVQLSRRSAGLSNKSLAWSDGDHWTTSRLCTMAKKGKEYANIPFCWSSMQFYIQIPLKCKLCFTGLPPSRRCRRLWSPRNG